MTWAAKYKYFRTTSRKVHKICQYPLVIMFVDTFQIIHIEGMTYNYAVNVYKCKYICQATIQTDRKHFTCIASMQLSSISVITC